MLVLVLCFSLEMVCDPLGDYNVWASTRPINNTAKGHKMFESVVIAAARVSYREEPLYSFATVQHLLVISMPVWVHENSFFARFCSDLTPSKSFPV